MQNTGTREKYFSGTLTSRAPVPRAFEESEKLSGKREEEKTGPLSLTINARLIRVESSQVESRCSQQLFNL